jgi:hypothetical protein
MWVMATWIGAGVLAATSITMAALALTANSDFNTKKDTLGSSRQDLENAESKSSAYALAADIIGGVTLGTIGVALYLTLTGPTKEEPDQAKEGKGGGFNVGLGPEGVLIHGRF